MASSCSYPAVRHLVLWLTTRCNLSCAYCYLGNDHRPLTMPERTAMAALDLAAASGKPFHVQLAGGEPTLEPQLIDAIGRKVRGEDMPASIALQTNGTKLTRPLAEMLRRWDIRVGVSIDGPYQQHEKLRGRYIDTIQGVEHLERAGVGFGVTAVVCAENAAHLPQLAMMLSSYECAHGLGLDLLVQRGRAKDGGPQPVDAAVLGEAMIDLATTMAWINRRRSTPLVLRELDRLRKKQKVFCNACIGTSLAVHPDGRLYPCGQTMDDNDLALGTIGAPDLGKIAGLAVHGLEGEWCAGCLQEGNCPGECPSRLKYNGAQGRQLACAMLRGLAMGARRITPKKNANAERGHATA